MKSILKTAFFYFNKIKVIHSIPGRLRLSVPYLADVPENMRKYDHYTTSLIKLEEGVESVSYSYVTGKVLLTYNPEKTDEKKIVNWINFVWKKIIDNQDVYNKMQPEEIERNLDKFYEMLCNELKKRG